MSTLKLEKRKDLLGKVEEKWFERENEDAILQKNLQSTEKCNNLELTNQYRNFAHQIYEQDLVNYAIYREKTRSSDHNWIRTVLSKGTTNDKISANCILIQDSAIHNLKSLDNLMAYVKVNKKRECIKAIDALKDLFITYLLPNRQLKNFNENQFELLRETKNDQERDKCLLYWYFESLLKIKYIQFIKAIQQVFQDTIAVTKIKLISTIMDLLAADKKEQEKNLIEIVINKLGDPDFKVASKVVYETNRLLSKVPSKNLDFLLEVERLVCRPNISQKAQVICTFFLSQNNFNQNFSGLSLKKYIKNKEIDNRMLNVILTGVNRAYKYSKMSNDDIDNNLNTLFKIVHVTSFNVSVQALMLLNQVCESRDDMQQRYYNALYRKLFDLEYKKISTKQTYFLNLLFNSMKKDDSMPRIKAFVKRLLQICLCQSVPFICGSLILLSELFKTKKNVLSFESNLIIREGVTQKLNASNKNQNTIVHDDDDKEVFHDVKDESDMDDDSHYDQKSNDGLKTKIGTSWLHTNNVQSRSNNLFYDYTQRNPMYCGADKTLTYELHILEKHFHPTVALFAKKLINDESIDYTGNPIEDFTLMHFLDRFVYKNPKRVKNKDSEEKHKSLFGTKISNKASSINQIPINSKAYLNIDINKIPEDEKIFYEFFKKQALKNKEYQGDARDEEILSEVSDSEFDEFLDRTQGDGISKKEDFNFDEIDFADGVSKMKKKGKNKSKVEEDEESDVEDEDDDEQFERELQKEIDEIDDDEDVSLDGDELDLEEDAEDEVNTKKLSKNLKLKSDNLFASADEFAELLNEAAEYDSFGVGSYSNKDNASAKQIKWEMNREKKTFVKKKIQILRRQKVH